MMGSVTLGTYSLSMFRGSNLKLSNYLLTVLIKVIGVLGYIISACIMKYVKRKHHFVASAALMCISNGVLAFGLYKQARKFLKISRYLDFSFFTTQEILVQLFLVFHFMSSFFS